jgi:hypothetical protein
MDRLEGAPAMEHPETVPTGPRAYGAGSTGATGRALGRGIDVPRWPEGPWPALSRALQSDPGDAQPLSSLQRWPLKSSLRLGRRRGKWQKCHCMTGICQEALEPSTSGITAPIAIGTWLVGGVYTNPPELTASNGRARRPHIKERSLRNRR